MASTYSNQKNNQQVFSSYQHEQILWIQVFTTYQQNKHHANKLTKLTRQEGSLILHSREANRKKRSYMIIQYSFFTKKKKF